MWLDQEKQDQVLLETSAAGCVWMAPFFHLAFKAEELPYPEPSPVRVLDLEESPTDCPT